MKDIFGARFALGYGQLGALYVDGARMADKSTRFEPAPFKD